LYLYVRNIEDGTQIIEHILPYFTPDYTIKINLIPEMGMIKEVPIILNSTEYEINYEGNRESDTRMIIWTLNFTAKAFLYRDTSTAGLIKHTTTNIYNKDTNNKMVEIDSFVYPPTANALSPYIVQTIITENSISANTANNIIITAYSSIDLMLLNGNTDLNLGVSF